MHHLILDLPAGKDDNTVESDSISYRDLINAQVAARELNGKLIYISHFS